MIKKNVSSVNNLTQPFFLYTKVRKSKDSVLKIRLQTLIHAKAMSEKEFYQKLGLSKQVWYDISWGRWDVSLWLKIKIAKELDVDSRVIWN